MDLEISGRVALVVGASKSMGRAAAVELAKAGCMVVAVARSPELLDELVQESLGFLGTIEAAPMDMMQPDSVAKLTDYFASRSLRPQIIYHAMGGSFDAIREWDRPASDWMQVWQFNLGRAHDINRVFIPAMVKEKWGRVVHTSSDATKNSIGNVPYTSSKFAVEGYVKTASKLFSKDNVIITAVSPGPIHTPGRWIYSQSPEDTRAYFDKYLPIQRFGTAKEVAQVIAFLCSERASFMPGAIVDVHGGSR